jgi:hypothetical protein
MLVKQIVERTGMSEDQAHQAVQMVVGFLKDKLPGPIGSQLDSVLSGQNVGGGMAGQAQQALGGLGGGLGGMFGGKKSDE